MPRPPRLTTQQRPRSPPRSPPLVTPIHHTYHKRWIPLITCYRVLYCIRKNTISPYSRPTTSPAAQKHQPIPLGDKSAGKTSHLASQWCHSAKTIAADCTYCTYLHKWCPPPPSFHNCHHYNYRTSSITDTLFILRLYTANLQYYVYTS